MKRPPRRGLLALGAAVLSLCLAPSAGATGFAGPPWLSVPGADGVFGIRTPLRLALPTPGTPFFVSELSALSWNALVSLTQGPQPGTIPALTPGTPLPNPLVLLNQDPISIPLRPPGGCSFLRPSACSNVQDLMDIDLRAGGNGQFGRRDFAPWTPIVGIEPIANGIYTPIVGISPITLGSLICNTSVGTSNPADCERPGPGAAVPEPSAALVFAAGLAVAAIRQRR